jgi:hypothetical protein
MLANNRNALRPLHEALAQSSDFEESIRSKRSV